LGAAEDEMRHYPLSPSEVAALWTDEQQREAAIYEMIRSVRKIGDFRQTAWLNWLAVPGGLSTAEVVALYETIRQECQRPELEWRPEFEAEFDHCRTALPAVSAAEVQNFWEQTLFEAIVVDRDLSQVKRGVEALQRAGIPLGALGRFAPEAVEEGMVAFASDGLSLRELAARVGAWEIEKFLQSSGAE
jgi:hypothetical protein